LVTKPETKYGPKKFTQVFRSLSSKETRQGYTQIHQKGVKCFQSFWKPFQDKFKWLGHYTQRKGKEENN